MERLRRLVDIVDDPSSWMEGENDGVRRRLREKFGGEAGDWSFIFVGAGEAERFEMRNDTLK